MRILPLFWLNSGLFFFLAYSVYHDSAPIYLGKNTEILISASAFLFSIFSGFFISYLGTRYATVRRNIATIDGSFAFIYRSATQFGPVLAEKVDTILRDHYQKIQSSGKWEYHLVNESHTIEKIHSAYQEVLGDTSYGSYKTQLINRMVDALSQIQQIRKNLIILRREQLSFVQWAVLMLIAFTFVISLHSFDSRGLTVLSLLKALFATSLVVVMYLMYKLNNLTLFERQIGSDSYEDLFASFDTDKS